MKTLKTDFLFLPHKVFLSPSFKFSKSRHEHERISAS